LLNLKKELLHCVCYAKSDRNTCICIHTHTHTQSTHLISHWTFNCSQRVVLIFSPQHCPFCFASWHLSLPKWFISKIQKFLPPTPNSITHLWTLWIFSDRIGKLLCCTSKTFKIITEAGITKIARKLVERSTFCPRQLWLLPKNLLSSLVS
jgi:hypothetical protein